MGFINKNSSIYVVGHTGMVGHSLVRMLKEAGFQNLVLRTRAQLDLTKQANVDEFFSSRKIDLVILLAGKVGGIQANVNDPVNFYLDNVLITTNVISSARKSGVRFLINIASSCMYPKNLEILRESDLLSAPLESTNEGYALAKLGAASFCKYISQKEGFFYKTLITCNLYGPFDKFDPEFSHMIPAAISKIYQAKYMGQDVIIWGDGSARREFMYIDDFSNAIIHAIEYLKDLPFLLNVGFGRDHSIFEYYQAIAEVIGYQGRFVYDLERPVGMNRKLLKTNNEILQWAPTYSLLEGLKLTCAFYEKEVAAKKNAILTA